MITETPCPRERVKVIAGLDRFRYVRIRSGPVSGAAGQAMEAVMARRRALLVFLGASAVVLGSSIPAVASQPTLPPSSALKGLCRALQSDQGSERRLEARAFLRLEARAFRRVASLADGLGVSVDALCAGVDQPLAIVNCDLTPFEGAPSIGFVVGFGSTSGFGGQVIGGVPPYSFSATDLPAGFVFNANGSVTHVDALPGTYPFTMTVEDSIHSTLAVSVSVTYSPFALPATC